MSETKDTTLSLSAPHRGTGGFTGGQGAFLYSLHLADNALFMGQRNSECTGHRPVLEQDIAITNMALDYLGQARNFYQHAAALYNAFGEEDKNAVDSYIPSLWKKFNRELGEDDLAFLRDEHQYLNLLITELPKGDWAFSILRQFFFSAFQFYQYRKLQQSSDAQLAAIAEKSIKETVYHLRWSGEWVIRLGDGTEGSHQRIKAALNDLWPFTSEMFATATYEETDVAALKADWLQKVQAVFDEATILLPTLDGAGGRAAQQGGKEGKHTAHFGTLLAEMQYLQRTYPNAIW